MSNDVQLGPAAVQSNAQQQAAQRNFSYLLAENLGQQFLAGDCQVGSILPDEMELGKQFGVNLTTVRETVNSSPPAA